MTMHPLPPIQRTTKDGIRSGNVPAQILVSPRGTLVNLFSGGDGAPVVALHGSGAQGQAWRGLLPALAGEFRLHAPDLYGCGRSEAFPGPGPATLEDEADLVGILLQHFNRPVHLIGHAYGGAVALQVAADYADRLCSLTLYEPAAFHLLKPDFGGHAPALLQIETLAADMRNACLRKEADLAARLFSDYWCGADSFARLPPQRQAALAAQASRLWSDIGVGLNGALSPEACRTIEVPALLLSGTRSPGTARLIADRLAALLPAARHATLPDLGHMAPTSHPDTVGRVAVTFLRACEQSSQRRACA